MAVTHIIQFDLPQDLSISGGGNKTVDDIIQQASEDLASSVSKGPANIVFGTHVQSPNTIQITTQWTGVQDYETFSDTTEFQSFIKTLRNSMGSVSSESMYHVSLSSPALGGPSYPAEAPFVEYAMSYFPKSRMAPDFRSRIDADFLKFEEIYAREATGFTSWTSGWVVEGQSHPDIDGGKDGAVECWVLVRGWNRMEDFEKSIQTEAYKEAIPLLFAWGAPFKMWHVQRKA